MKFNEYSGEETCGKRARYGDLNDLACLRTEGHTGEGIAMACDVAVADGVHLCCRTKLDLDHHALCRLHGADGKMA